MKTFQAKKHLDGVQKQCPVPIDFPFHPSIEESCSLKRNETAGIALTKAIKSSPVGRLQAILLFNFHCATPFTAFNLTPSYLANGLAASDPQLAH